MSNITSLTLCSKDILVNNDANAEELSALKTLELRKMFQDQSTTQLQVSRRKICCVNQTKTIRIFHRY